MVAFLLVFTVTAVTIDPRVPAGSASLAIGFALAAGVLLGGPVSGEARNPARALGPMIVSGVYPSIFIYIIGPLVGGVVGALLYARLIAGTSARRDRAGEIRANWPSSIFGVRPYDGYHVTTSTGHRTHPSPARPRSP